MLKPCTAADGIYFDLPENTYHALPRLSSSGIANMMISPGTFWAKSWLNPDLESEDKSFQQIGRAYHCARFEPDRLRDRFVPELKKEDFPDALLTDAEIKNALKDAGQPQTKAGEGVLDRAHRLRDLGFGGIIWHLELEAWEKTRGDRVGIPAKVWAEIERDTVRLHQNPEIAALMTGGEAEVSILWTDAATGVQMKARLDYLKPASITDFKTFDNSRGKHVEQVLAEAVRFNRYYIQASTYWQAVELVRRGGLAVIGDATHAQRALVASIAQNPVPTEFWYVFQEKNGVPNLFAREFAIYHMHLSMEIGAPEDKAKDLRRKYGSETLIYRKGDAAIRYAQNMLKNMSEIYGDGEPWFPLNPIGRLSDEDFSLNWLEGDW
jgi:hypothetical protein